MGIQSSLLYEPGDPDFVVNQHLTIDHETEVVKDYLAELRAIRIQDDIRRLVEKWSGLIPECKPLLAVGDDQLPLLREFLNTPPERQDEEWMTRNREWMNALVPPTTFGIVKAARHYGVTTGLVILQLLGHAGYEVEQDGDNRILRLVLPERKPTEADTSSPDDQLGDRPQ